MTHQPSVFFAECPASLLQDWATGGLGMLAPACSFLHSCWDVLAQKPAGAKLKCLYIQLF